MNFTFPSTITHTMINGNMAYENNRVIESHGDNDFLLTGTKYHGNR